MVYIKANIPHRLLTEYSGVYEGIDYLSFELVLKSKKWHVTYFYRPPSVNVNIFVKFLSDMCDVFLSKGDVYVASGDCNINCLTKNSCLNDLCDIYGLDIRNINHGPTCFKGDTPSLIDVFITNRPNCFSNCFNVDLGISDFHTCLGLSSKIHVPADAKRKIFYRSKKKFCPESFKRDCSYIPFQICEIFDDTDDIYWAHSTLFSSVIEEHAPLKTKTVHKKQAPFMNSKLRKAIFQRNMWRNKFYKQRNNKIFRINYSTWQNKVSRLRKLSIKGYIESRCNNEVGSKNFYATVKPFLKSQENFSNGGRIILRDNEDIVSDPHEVANIFNDYFASIAEYSDSPDGLDINSLPKALLKHRNHPSIIKINEHKFRNSNNIFNFTPVNADFILKFILKL